MFKSIWSFLTPSYIKSFFSSLLISLGVINSSFIVPETPTEMRKIIAYDDSKNEEDSFILKEDGTLETLKKSDMEDSKEKIIEDEKLSILKELNHIYYNFSINNINNQLQFIKDMNFLYEFENSEEGISTNVEREKTAYNYQYSLSENQKNINNQYNNFIANLSTKTFLYFPNASMNIYSIIHDDFLTPSKISTVKITPSEQEYNNTNFYQGDTIYFFDIDKTTKEYSFSTCTLGYIDTKNRIAYTAKHCGKHGQSVYKSASNNRFIKIGIFDKNIDNIADDSAIIRIRDDIKFDPYKEYNYYSKTQYTRIDDIEKGDEICRYGARTQEVMCGEIIDINKSNLVFVGDSKLFSLRGDSGGPFWIPGKGYIGILYGKIFIGNRVNILGTIMTPEIVKDIPKNESQGYQKDLPNNIKITFLED